MLSRRLGLEVTADGVEELARQGLLPVTGSCKQHALYDGRALEAFTGTGAAAEATRAGRLRTAGQAAAYLRIRRSDLNHLTRSGVLKPVKYGHGPWDRRNEASVPLYRTGDLDQLTARPGIDWAAVRATAPRPAFPARRHRRRRSHPGRARRPARRAAKAATVSGQDRPAPGVVHLRLTRRPGRRHRPGRCPGRHPRQCGSSPARTAPTPACASPGTGSTSPCRLTQPPTANAPTGQMEGNPDEHRPRHHSARARSSLPGRADPLHADPESRRVPGRPARRTEPRRTGTGGIPVTTSAPPPRDPELAADPDYRQAAAGDWHGRVADYYAEPASRSGRGGPRAGGPGGPRHAEIDARQMDAQHQDALAENQARGRAAEATEPEASL